MSKQPDALQFAEWLERGPCRSGDTAIASELRRLHSLCAAWEKKAATWLSSSEAVQQLEGYRELAQQTAHALNQRDEMLGVLKAFSDYVRNEQNATDGAVTYSTTAINHWAFLARAAIAKVEGGAA